MQLFDIASQHIAWLSKRQSVLAQNIANADTPGYQTRDVAQFASVMRQAEMGLAVTNSGHMAVAQHFETAAQSRRPEVWDRSLSGNDVAVEAELMKAGETSRMMAFDTGLMRVFHRMILGSLKV